MDDNNEYDIYDDLDVFDSDEKQQEQVIQFSCFTTTGQYLIIN